MSPDFVTLVSIFTLMFKIIVGVCAVGMVFIWPRLDATTSRLNLLVFRYGGMAFWIGLVFTHMFEAHRIFSIITSNNVPPPLGTSVLLYGLGGLLKAIGLPIVLISAFRWSRLRIITPAVSLLVDKMIDEAEDALAEKARAATTTSDDVDADVGVVSESGRRGRGPTT